MDTINQYTINDIIDISKDLKFKSLESNINDLLEQAVIEKWTHQTIIYNLFQIELMRKEKLIKQGMIRRANFPQIKYLEDLDRKELPEAIQVILPKLETLEFIRDGRNIILTGNPGTGKTHIAIGLGVKACKAGYKVLFTTIHELLTTIRETRSERKLRQFEQAFVKYDLVICDELGYVNLTKEGADMVFNLLSLRAEIKSTIVTTNLAFDLWVTVFADKILTGAIIDRLTHKAYIANMNGQSYRTKETIKFNQENMTRT